MPDFKALSIFVKVAERRSFIRAAHDLGVTQSGVSNAINRLESELGVRLLARTTRSVGLTEDGAAYLDRCRQILASLDEAESVLNRARLKPSGRLRVDMPVAFGRIKVVPLLPAFRADYPEVELALSFTDRYVDLVGEGIDMAIRFGELKDSSLIARRLKPTRFGVVGAPDYFAEYGRPRRPEDVAGHNCLSFVSHETGMVRDWQFERDGATVAVTPKGAMSFTDGAALCVAACAGLGLAQLHGYYTDEAIGAGGLVPVLRRFSPPASPISLVYPTSRHLAPKVRAFVDFMVARLG
jgi:DNA-binding transcriptional LysR family regulator